MESVPTYLSGLILFEAGMSCMIMNAAMTAIHHVASKTLPLVTVWGYFDFFMLSLRSVNYTGDASLAVMVDRGI